MKHQKLLELARHHLENNDLGVEHTLRVLNTAKKNYSRYDLDESWKDTVLSLIILHDIGGSTIKEQYENGPKIAQKLLKKLNYPTFDIKLICKMISKHHEKLSSPHDAFKILFDSDRLVMFSEEEFKHYETTDWQKIINDFYDNDVKNHAIKTLEERKK